VPIATSTINPDIPFRPDADPTNCPGPGGNGANDIGGRWFDPVSGACNNSLSVPLTFPFPATQPLPSTVVWTVQFNTSNYGYNPIVPNMGAQLCNAFPQGCGYDSLNVGAKTYAPTAFAGTDVDNDVAFI